MSSVTRHLLVAAMAALLATVATPALAGGQPAKVDAAALYKTRCLLCHTANGAATKPEMNLADDAWRHGTSVAAISEVIRNGVKGTAMLAFKGKLSDPEIDALARYVRAFDTKLKPENH